MNHYQWLKATLSSLHKKALGDNPEVKLTAVSAGKPKAPSHFSGTLSFIYANNLGYRVKLMFPLDITTDDYALSCEEFVKLIAAHEQKLANDPLGREIDLQARAKASLHGNAIPAERTHPTIPLLIFWNRHAQCFHVADPIASSRHGRLVSKEIGGD